MTNYEEVLFKQIAKALKTITEYLEESHQVEILKNHFGDPPEQCSYCREIKNAKWWINIAEQYLEKEIEGE